MKKYFFCIVLLSVVRNATAQNVGIGTTEPLNKLQVQGNLLVTTPTVATNTAPTVAQTKTMVNASTISFSFSDSTGRVYDPGGPSGNYNSNITANANIDFVATNSIGTEIILENVDLGTGDSLIIKESSISTDRLLAVGNGYNTNGKWIFNSASLYIIFKSNADANNGQGFSLLFRRLYDNSAVLPHVSGFAGGAFFFNSKTAALRSGYIVNTSPMGLASVAFGSNTTASGSGSFATGYFSEASGTFSVAMGIDNTASGNTAIAFGKNTTSSSSYSTTFGHFTTASGGTSTAFGYNTLASDNYAVAMGYESQATGHNSTAMGDRTQASGFVSTAMGTLSIASGNFSTAMGNHVSTNNQEGSFVIGDYSTATVMNSPAPNNFRARFANGYRLYTSANYSTSCSLGAGDNAWTTGSSVHTKENFAEVNGEDFLKKIAGFHLTSWNYKTQDPATFRHYGPMAQDFYAAFGKDKYGTIGNDTTINSADFAGVSFIAIQALEKRTQKIEQLEIRAQKIEQIEKANNDLKKENVELKEMILLLRKEMDELKKTGTSKTFLR